MKWFAPIYVTLEWMVFFKPNRNQIWSWIEKKNDMDCIYMYMHIHWTGYSKGAREEE